MNADSFLDHAIQFREAAKRLHGTTPFLFKPTFYCAIHAVELALKGHLVHSGLSPGDLRRREFGHNIDRLLEHAEKIGANSEELLDYFAQQAVRWGSKDYAGKCFEYPEVMYSTCSLGVWLDIGEDLIERLRSAVRSVAPHGADLPQNGIERAR